MWIVYSLHGCAREKNLKISSEDAETLPSMLVNKVECVDATILRPDAVF